MTVPGKRPTGRHHGDLRNALQDAALQLIGERGLADFTLAEASRRAGVSVAAPYKHFADKDALLAALALAGYREQRRRYGLAFDAPVNPVERMARFATAYVRFAVEERALFDVTFSGGFDRGPYPELLAAGDELIDYLVEQAASVRGTADEARTLILAVGAVAHGFAAFVVDGILGAHDAAERAAAAGRALAAGRLE